VERRLRDLAAAASAAGSARLRPGGAATPTRPAAGRGALTRALDAATARIRVATAQGDLSGVAQGLRDAALVAPALGDVVARRATARRATPRARAERRLAAGLRRFAGLSASAAAAPSRPPAAVGARSAAG
jgi:hypothetical protein